MKNFASIIYAICVIVICALIIAGGIMLFKNFGENLSGDSNSSSISNSGTQNSGKTSSNNSNSGSHSSGGSSATEPNYAVREYSFTLANGYNPLENYGSSYRLVIPMDNFSTSLPNDGYTTYTVSESDGETIDEYLGDRTPLVYYEIKYEYGWDYYTKIILIPRSAFTITGGQLFVAPAVPESVFTENFYESIYSDGTFFSIKIVSRDVNFFVRNFDS